MESWKEILFSVLVVVGISLFFNFSDMPPSYGKYFSYFGVAVFPVTYAQLSLFRRKKIRLDTGDFLFGLFLNTSVVLFFSMVVLSIFFEV